MPLRIVFAIFFAPLFFCTWVPTNADDFPLRRGTPGDVGISKHLLDVGVDLVRQSVDSGDIHGAVLLVARKGRIVLHEAIGWRNAEDRSEMQRDTLFKMASNTKPVIAAAILQLVERGDLQLDAAVGDYISSWKDGANAGVTVRQLLSHTSGLRIPVVFVEPLLAKSDANPHAPSLQAEVDRFAEIGVKEEPGNSFSYNNPGFQVLGRLIEVASGQPLKDYLRESIYRPLKMKDSWNHESDVPLDRMSRVYAWKDGKRVLRWKPEDGPDWPIVRGSGGMITTARDYAVFCQMFLNCGIYAGARLLTQDSIAEATRPQTLGAHSADELATRGAFYGLGWVISREGVFSHSGSDGTKVWVDPDRELIVMVLTQSPGGDHPRDRFFDTVLAACDRIGAPQSETRPRLRDLGISIGRLPVGPTNTITDVAGVQVGHHTIHEGDSIRTGVTAVKPHEGNVFLRKAPAAVHVANGFGKFVGTTQVDELGLIETPILLTNTLSTFAAADGLVGWTLAQPGCESVRSVNPIVGECNDGFLNDIRARRVGMDDVITALRRAHGGPVTEGCVGAGTGVRCMGWKGGIGSSSRRLPKNLGGFTIGVLVQTNFGGSLTVDGTPVGPALGRYFLKEQLGEHEHGSCIVIVATDAPLDSRRLQRLARRAPLGLAAVGSPITHGSGDYVLAFSTHSSLRSKYQSQDSREKVELLRDDELSPLFQAVKDATEEAVINSLLQAETTTGREGRTIEAIDPNKVREVWQNHRGKSAAIEEPGSTEVSVRMSSPQLYGRHDSMPPKAKLDLLERQMPVLMKQYKVPGVSVALVSNRQLVWSRGFGVRCAGTNRIVTPKTIMEACSMSKPFFAYLLLQQVQAKRFDLDRPLVEYLESDYESDDDRHRQITARMTLTHTSGLPNWRSGGWRSKSRLKVAFDPGSRFRYSGEGFLMLQRALEQSLDVDLASLAMKQLVKPLQMHNTGFVWEDRFVARAACGHDRQGQVKGGRSHYDRANAAYTLYTSAEDYARFLVEMLREDRGGPYSLSTTMRDLMLTPVSHREDQDADWGLGWGIRKRDDQTQVFHGGANGSGFRCYSEFSPESGDGLVIMTNALAGDELWKQLVEQWRPSIEITP